MAAIRFHRIQRGSDRHPVLLFLHGFMGSSEDWLPVMEALAGEYCCVAIDLPGHGNCDAPDPASHAMEITAQAIADGLSDWLAQHATSLAAVVGYSMGGRLALYLALTFPQGFPQAVLVSASPGLASLEARKSRRAEDLRRAQQIVKNFKVFLIEWYQQPLFSSLWKTSLGSELTQKRLRNNPQGLANSLQYMGLGSQPSLWKELSNYGRSLGLMVGELDPKFRAIAAEMQRYCPTAERVIVPGAGHNIPSENPAVFVRELRRLLTRLSSEPRLEPGLEL